MTRFAIMTGVLLSIVLVAGWAGAAGTVLGLHDNGKGIEVQSGEAIELALEEQGGTGYTWEFNKLDDKHFKVLGTETKHPAGQPRIGGPVLKVWHLQAIAQGNAVISLDYLRPWEGRAKAVKHFQVNVHIQ